MRGAALPANVRRLVAERAGFACEYCGIPDAYTFFAHEVDHVIFVKHGGASEPDNLAFACRQCNTHKGADIASLDPLDGSLVPLFNPRRDPWSRQFRLNEAIVVPLTATGRATAGLLQLNAPARVEERLALVLAGVVLHTCA